MSGKLLPKKVSENFKRTRFISRTQKLLSNMSGSLILCTAFFLAANIQATLATDGNAFAKAPMVCESPGCLTTAFEILSSMDNNTEPCVDFYNFVCKNWRNNNPDLPEIPVRDQFVNAEFNLLFKMKETLEAPDEGYEPDDFKLAKKLYAACIDESQPSYLLQADALQDILVRAGYWPILYNSQTVNRNSWHSIDLFFVTNYASTSFYNVEAIKNKANPDKYDLTITPPKILRPASYMGTDKESSLKYSGFIEHTIWTLIGHEAYTALNVNTLFSDIDKMIEFENKLINASDPNHEFCINENGTPEWLNTLFENSGPKSKIDWVARLTTIPGVKSDSPLVTSCAKYLELLVGILNSTDDVVIVNYIHWRFVVNTLPFITRPLRNKLYKDKAHKPRWQQCIEENEAIEAVHYDILEKQTLVDIKEAYDVYDMVDATAAWRFLSFKDRFPNSQLLYKIYEKHEDLPVHIAHPDYYFQKNRYQSVFPAEKVKPLYIENIIEKMKYRPIVEVEKTKSNFHQTLTRSNMTAHEARIVGGAFSDGRYIPAGLLQQPFYDSDRPQSLNYGALGSVIGYSIMKEYYDYLIAAYKRDSRIMPMPEASMPSFISHGQMTVDKWNIYPLKTKKSSEVVSKDDLHQIFSHNAMSDAVKAAYIGYQRDFKLREWKDVRLRGLEKYDHNQLFFISYANAYCSTPNRLDLTTTEEISESVLSELDMEVRRKVILSLMETEAFGQAFQCKKGTWMAPVHFEPYW